VEYRSSKFSTHFIEQGRFFSCLKASKRKTRNGISTIPCILLENKTRRIIIKKIFLGGDKVI
jgi:hypothetical protein